MVAVGVGVAIKVMVTVVVGVAVVAVVAVTGAVRVSVVVAVTVMVTGAAQYQGETMTSVKLAADQSRLTSYTTSRTARERLPSFGVYVIWWSLIMAAGAGIGGAAVGLAVSYIVTVDMTGGYPSPSELVIYSRFFGMTFFAVFFIYALHRQINQWETLVRDTEQQEYEPRQQVQQVARPVGSIADRRVNVRVGKPEYFPDTQQKATALYFALLEKDWKFIRDALAEAETERGAKVFVNISANFPAILEAWEDMGYVANGKVTEDGRFWIEDNCLPGTFED